MQSNDQHETVIKDGWQQICQVNEIGNPGSFGFTVQAGKYPLYGFVVQERGEVFGYKNTCPHAGRPLDWAPHAFLTKDKANIMCSAHGALFKLDNGLCVAGPCLGRSLKSWNIRIEDQVVWAEIPPEPVVT